MYSVKNILAHLEAYERALVTWLREAAVGRIYIDPVVDLPDLERRNAIIYKGNRNRSAADILAAYRQTMAELLESVAKLTDEQLNSPGNTDWLVVPSWQRSQELWRCIASDSYEHHRQHLPDIERWLERRGLGA